MIKKGNIVNTFTQWFNNILNIFRKKQVITIDQEFFNLIENEENEELYALIESQENPVISHKYDIMEMINLHADDVKRYSTCDIITLEELKFQNLNLK